jgi:ferrous-iron efflux pump FieF
LLHPEPLRDLEVGLVVAGIAIVATVLSVTFQRHVVRRTGSPAIRADALHYAADVAIVAALVLAAMGLDRLDPLFGLAIGLYVFYSGLRIARDATDALLDRELPETERRAIASLSLAEPGVRAVHGLRTRRSGQIMVIQLHLELDDDVSLVDAHRLSVDVERRIRERWPDSDVTIHQDPVSVGRE